jgi:copper oxidase (laccase) domain-containing protein
MILAPGFAGAAFGTAADGDRSDRESRRQIAAALGIPSAWAWLRQVHGSRVLRAIGPGLAGNGDALVTTVAGLPMAVATADCYAVILEGDGGVGIAHVGWRGAAVGIVGATRLALERLGVHVRRAAVGPGIGPCCFEVGADVAVMFDGSVGCTTWGAPSVDLVTAFEPELSGLEVWRAGVCTMCGDGFHSYRRDGTRRRQVALAWLTD